MKASVQGTEVPYKDFGGRLPSSAGFDPLDAYQNIWIDKRKWDRYDDWPNVPLQRS